MKKQLITTLAIALLSFGTSAVQASELKLGFVNTERIFKESAPAVKAQTKLQKEFAPKDQELQRMGKKVSDLQRELDKNGVTLSEANRRNKERDLAGLQREFQRIKREFSEDFSLRRSEELGQIQDRANKAIQAIAESEKFDMILQEVVYASPRIDITDKVLKALAGDK